MIHPEKCLVETGKCDPTNWAHQQCHQEHLIYLANSSRLKVDEALCGRLVDVGDGRLNLSKESASGTARLIVRDQNPKPNNFSFLGKITEISESSLSLSNFTQKELPATKVSLAPSTVIKKSGKTIRKYYSLYFT